MDDSPARLILPPELADNPDYEVLRELGRGGMGIVYLAKHRLSGRVEVLKVMNKDQLGRAESRKRFLREIQSAALLDHKNVVKMHTALERGELMVLVMEYVPGEDLAEVIDKRGALSVLHACYYVQQVASGLQHAFEKDMIHRDIKPQNLMLLREGKKHVVKILDFGLAKVACEAAENTGLTGAGKIMGTPDYIAPEQTTDAAPVDIRADIYSLGCTLYHLLAGDTPFAGKNAYAVIYAHQSFEAPLLHVVRPEVPESLSAVVAKMMAKNPVHRYQSPLEVMQALDPFVKGVPPPSLPQSAAPPSLGEAGVSAPGVPTLPLPQSAAPKRVQRVAASPSLLNRETILVGNATVTGARKPVGAMRSRKWLGVSLAVVLLAGLLGLIVWVTPKKPLSSERVAIQKTTLRNELFIAEKDPLPPVKAPEKDPLPPVKAPEKKPLPAIKTPQKTVTNSMGMKFAWCPPGEFQMGSPPGEEKRSDDETQHKVTLSKGFYLGIHEVTQAQWRAVMGNNPSHFKGDDLPVETVSWEDCQAFCTKLGQMDGKRYRLPTEAEWEYACRAGAKTAYCFGDDSQQLGDYAWYNGNSDFKTHAVGTRKPNAWGLYDMHGNVFERCQDWYGSYQKEDIKDPKGNNNGDAHVLRGGSQLGSLDWCRAAYRNRDVPGFRYVFFGCRVVLCLD